LITHFHGDHCLGLPGVLQRMSVDRPGHAVDVVYPASGQVHLDALRHLAATGDAVAVREHPSGAGVVLDLGAATVTAAWLSHRIDTLGYRVDEPAGRRMLPERLAAAGISGPDVGRLRRDGEITVSGRTVSLEEVSEPRPGQSVALVMDTRWCEAALELARGVDVLVCEATFLERHADLAPRYGHLTAAQAATLAAEAGARRVVLTHFSQRYPHPGEIAAEARAAAAGAVDVVVARDLDRVALPPRRGAT
jgi:ribonuclease Z